MMKLFFESGATGTIDPAEHILVPLDKKPGEAFDANVDRWECDRAWLFAVPGNLIDWNGKVEKIKSVIR